MASDIERLRKGFKGNKFAEVRSLLRVAAKLARREGAPEHFSDGSKSQETTVTEQLVLRERFTDEEKEALRNDGAVIYLLHGETILSQKESQRAKGKPSFGYVVDAGERLLALPSRKIEVAIYPDPEKFFVPGSFNKSVKKQEEKVMQDARELRLRLNLSAVTEIIPDEAATLSEIGFQHLDATGVWLFGKEYAVAQGLDWVYGRTKNPTNASGSIVAYVGNAYPDSGLDVGGWRRDDGLHSVGALRLVVPIENG